MNRHFSKEDIQMAHKHIKKCPTSLAIREMQIKTTMRYTSHTTRRAVIRRQTTSVNKDVEKLTETLIHCWWEYKMVQPLWKTVWQFIKSLNIELPHDPATPSLNIYPRELKTYAHTKT